MSFLVLNSPLEKNFALSSYAISPFFAPDEWQSTDAVSLQATSRISQHVTLTTCA
jgi:hypothetical protein